VNDKYILDENGNAVAEPDLLKWAKWYESGEGRRLAIDTLSGDITVSTVFLGLDHSFCFGPPLLWETMIFGGEHDGYQERYSTRQQALDGHAEAFRLANGLVAPGTGKTTGGKR